MNTYTFTVTGMHCASCALLIDDAVEEEIPGVERSQTSLRKGLTTVLADETVAPEAIAAVIASQGYQANLEILRRV